MGLADCYAILSEYRLETPSLGYAQAASAAIKALQIDGSLAEAHATLGLVRSRHDWQWQEGETEFRKAVDLAPNYATAHQWYGTYLFARSRPKEAMVQVKQAQELDPLSPIIDTSVGYTYYFARQYEAAIPQFLKALDLEPNFVTAHFYLGSAYEQQRKYREAAAEFEKAIRASNGASAMVAGLAHAYAISGDRLRAEGILHNLVKPNAQQYVSPYSVAAVYAALGDRDPAFDHLESAYQERAGSMVLLRIDPAFDSLHNDPRFSALIRLMGL